MRVGVLGGSSFARRTMVPALARSGAGTVSVLGSRSAETAAEWSQAVGCEGVVGYEQVIDRADVDLVYLPLPAALTGVWARRALEAGKHVLAEKPLAAAWDEARELVELARAQGLLLMENFHFLVHAQWARLRELMNGGAIGEVHLVRSTFGFPPLPPDNIRWKPELGGGALLDAGAYMAKVAQQLLGPGLEVVGASLLEDPSTGVDRYGEAMFRNAGGQVAQVAFGFDYFYQCRLELLGTRGKASSGRVFTAKPGEALTVLVETPGDAREEALPSDDAYANQWRSVAGKLESGDFEPERASALDQARLLDTMRRRGSPERPQ